MIKIEPSAAHVEISRPGAAQHENKLCSDGMEDASPFVDVWWYKAALKGSLCCQRRNHASSKQSNFSNEEYKQDGIHWALSNTASIYNSILFCSVSQEFKWARTDS